MPATPFSPTPFFLSDVPFSGASDFLLRVLSSLLPYNGNFPPPFSPALDHLATIFSFCSFPHLTSSSCRATFLRTSRFFPFLRRKESESKILPRPPSLSPFFPIPFPLPFSGPQTTGSFPSSSLCSKIFISRASFLRIVDLPERDDFFSSCCLQCPTRFP